MNPSGGMVLLPSSPMTSLLAALSITVAYNGSTIVGKDYCLSCSVTGADSFNFTSITYQWFNETGSSQRHVRTQQIIKFNPLQLYHVGEYMCVVTLSGFAGNVSLNTTQNIRVESKSNHSYYLALTMWVNHHLSFSIYIHPRVESIHYHKWWYMIFISNVDLQCSTAREPTSRFLIFTKKMYRVNFGLVAYQKVTCHHVN